MDLIAIVDNLKEIMTPDEANEFEEAFKQESMERMDLLFQKVKKRVNEGKRREMLAEITAAKTSLKFEIEYLEMQKRSPEMDEKLANLKYILHEYDIRYPQDY